MELTQEIVKELVEYDPLTGVVMWKHRDQKWFNTNRAHSIWNARYANKRAGCELSGSIKAYRVRKISLFANLLLEHRLVWFYMTGEWPPSDVDHKNRDATDNRWENLRISCAQENSKNQSMRSDNKSGATGVFWSRQSNRWVSSVKVSGVQKTKFLQTKEEAISMVLSMRKVGGFSDGHGSPRITSLDQS